MKSRGDARAQAERQQDAADELNEADHQRHRRRIANTFEELPGGFQPIAAEPAKQLLAAMGHQQQAGGDADGGLDEGRQRLLNGAKSRDQGLRPGNR